MPVFQSGIGLAPAWCELEYFEIIRLSPGSTHEFQRIGRREKLFIGEGKLQIDLDGKRIRLKEGDYTELRSVDGVFSVHHVMTPCTLIRVCGRWGDEVGDCGVFALENSSSPHNGGDPVDYPKKTNFDSHYHDCDEYWILFEGSGVAVTEGKKYKVQAGDCVATGRGHHHDFPVVYDRVRGVYVETTLEGPKRRGHLWEHTHGRAEPKLDRMS